MPQHAGGGEGSEGQKTNGCLPLPSSVTSPCLPTYK